MQNALANIGQGIQKYQENKVLQSEIMGGVEQNLDFLIGSDPESLQNAPKAVQDVLRRMEDGKGVGLKDAAYLNSWSQSAAQQARVNIENNALASAFARNLDGTLPTGQESVINYINAGGQDPSVFPSLLNVGSDSLKREKLEQELTGKVPLTLFEERQLKLQEAASDVAAEKAQRDADDAKERMQFAREANDRANQKAAASEESAMEQRRLDDLGNRAIGFLNQNRDEYNKFLERLSPEDQGVVLTQVQQYESGIPTESGLTAGAISDILMEKDSDTGSTFAEYLNKIRQAEIKEVKENKYVVGGVFNDIKKIPAFEELIKRFPQFKVPLNITTDNVQQLPSGSTITLNPPPQ